MNRTVAGVAIGATLVALSTTLVLRLMEDPADSEPWAVNSATVGEEGGNGEVVEHPRVVVRGHESQYVEVTVDGELFFADRLDGGVNLEPPAGREVVVELADLTRAVVIYNNERVQPLGKLTAGRRLVFINDSF